MPQFTPKDRFFDPLVAFLANHIGVTLALVIQRRSEIPSLEGKLGGIAATAAGLSLWYEISPLLQTLEKGEWPKAINYTEEASPTPPDLPKDIISRTGRVHALAAQAMFVQYVDGVESLINRRQKEPLIRFAIKVRNFAAHGGRIDIKANAPRLTWRSVTWTAAEHGRPLLAGDVKSPGGAMSAGDLIVLMRDVDAVLV